MATTTTRVSAPPATGQSPELLYLPVLEQARLIAGKQISPVELVRASLDRIDRLNPKLNAFLTVCSDHALTRAREAEAQVMAGNYLGPLHGIPYGAKDNIMTKGIRSTGGSVILKDYVPDEDASTIQRLNAAGAILVGKTHLTEFATGMQHPFYGPARNPWDTERTPGGSSSGSGSGVASGMLSFALGTDTGGSVRGPGSMNGIYGLRATYGKISRHGVYVLSWTLDAVGPLARTVRDIALVTNVISGQDGLDPALSPVPVRNHSKGINGSIKGLRIGVYPDVFYDGATPEVVAAVDEALGVFQRLGATVKKVQVPHIELSASVYHTVVAAEATVWHEEWVRTRASDYAPPVQNRFEVGQFLLAKQYIKALRARSIIRDAWLNAFKDVDIFLTPTSPKPADKIDLNPAGSRPSATGGGYTQYFSIPGVPSMSVPCGFSSEGLPLSMLLNGRPFEEATIFRAARAYERETEWTSRHPAI